jgi:hypothetical protein
MNVEKSDIHKHLDLVQGLINRMASNSASCKNYCITLVGALLALEQVKKEGSLIFLAFVPILAFAFLDMYYLYLETFFRVQFKLFVTKWQTQDELEKTDLFTFGKPKTGWPVLKESFYQIWSLSIWPFYGFLFAVVLALLLYTNSQGSGSGLPAH